MNQPIKRRFLVLSLASVVALATAAPASQPGPEAFDGSFELETGEVITGGYMVENGAGRYLFMDTEGLKHGSLFEPVGPTVLRSVGILDERQIEVEFVAGTNGAFDTVIWRAPGKEPVRGRRIHPHRSRSVRFASGDGTQLEGRLLLPECEGPHPLVVSVHGSGPVNRYGGTFHTFFLKYGVAVLAYDKRGFTTDADDWLEPDLTDLSADAAAAVTYAAELPDVDDDRIGLFGTSQGGWVVPPAAIAAPDTDFQILRVGAATAPGDTILHEARQELRADGLSGYALDQATDLYREIYMLAGRGAPITATDALVAPYLDEPWYGIAFGDGPVSALWSAHWWSWLGRNYARASAPYLQSFDGPVLWFLAEQDENVPLVRTRAALEQAFAAAPGDDHEIVVIEDAPHSFIIETADGGQRYADGFFSYMAKWMAARGLTDPACRDSQGRSPPS